MTSTERCRESLAKEYLVHSMLLTKRSESKAFDAAAKPAYAFYDGFEGENIYRVYPRDYLCADRYCYGVKDGVILISDDDHPSDVTAKWIVDQIFQKLQRGND